MNGKRFFRFFFGECSHPQYLVMKKEKYGGSKIEMDLSSILADAPTSIGVSVCQ
jgi:hypothetical protein